jgi:polyhydroxybutyrate depolymerase
VIVHVPPGDDGRTALPLVLNLHGSGSTAAAQEAFTGMDATADTDHFVVAYPQGAIASGTGFDWAVPGQPLAGGAPLPADAPNDVAYLTGLVADLEARYCLDRARIYATGFSGGGRMTSQLGCDASTVFAAVGPLSGLRRPVPCPATRPVPVISFHGTADPVDPYAGHGQAYWTYSVPTAARRWAAGDRCRSGPTVTHPDPTVTRSAWSGCAGGSAVVLYTVAGMGHRWPGGTPLPRRYDRLLGPPSDAIDANAVLWAFFDAHPMPTRPNGLPRTG